MIVEKDVTMVTIPEIGYPDHGTAVLGQLSALDESRDWGEPTQGITGIVPEAQPYFYALFHEKTEIEELTAWFRAALELGPGDVICAPYDPAGILTSCAENEAIVTISQLAAAEGIVCVVAAGNGRQECISATDAGELAGDDGMIIVGGVTPAGLVRPTVNLNPTMEHLSMQRPGVILLFQLVTGTCTRQFSQRTPMTLE